MLMTRSRMKIKKGDTVQVLTGKDRGKRGTVVKAMHEESRVVVDGVNKKKKHVKPQGGNEGRIVEVSGPIHVSNVAIIDPKTDKPTRIGYKTVKDIKKRVAKGSGSNID